MCELALQEVFEGIDLQGRAEREEGLLPWLSKRKKRQEMMRRARMQGGGVGVEKSQSNFASSFVFVFSFSSSFFRAL